MSDTANGDNEISKDEQEELLRRLDDAMRREEPKAP